MPEMVSAEEQTIVIPKGRILVVDDESDIRESLDALLSMEGYQVDLAPNATEGQRKIESHL